MLYWSGLSFRSQIITEIIQTGVSALKTEKNCKFGEYAVSHTKAYAKCTNNQTKTPSYAKVIIVNMMMLSRAD